MLETKYNNKIKKKNNRKVTGTDQLLGKKIQGKRRKNEKKQKIDSIFRTNTD